jgi:hypothetical protein
MSEQNLLLGSLSNDLLRIASLTQRGSIQAAEKFYEQTDRWLIQLKDTELKPYIRKIVEDLLTTKYTLNLASAEKFLMYSVLLQNYSLHEKN